MNPTDPLLQEKPIVQTPSLQTKLIYIKEYGEKRKNPVLQKWVDKNEVFLSSMEKNPMMDAVIEEIDQRKIRIGNQWLIDFASCNYLGFDLDPEIIEGVPEYLRKWGTHPSWSRMLGSPIMYPQIEEQLTELLHVEDCLLLPNLTMISRYCIFLLSEGGEIFLDKYSHSTLYEGAAVARGFGATLTYFRNDRMEELEELLKNSKAHKKMICIDGVYSMHGKYADIPRVVAMARKYDALLYIDDAHGFGVIGERGPDELCSYGKKGNCIVNYYNESYDNIVMIGGLSKAYSTYMAFITCNKQLKDYLKVMVTPYLYTGPVPVASLATGLKGLEVNRKRGDLLRLKLYQMCHRLNQAIDLLGFRNENDTDFPIFNFYLKNIADFDFMTDWLFKNGVYVTLCPYPMVPRNDVGFRVQLTAANTDEEVDHLVSKLKALSQLIEFQTVTNL